MEFAVIFLSITTSGVATRLTVTMNLLVCLLPRTFLVYLQNLEPFISDFRCFILNSLSLIFLHDL